MVTFTLERMALGGMYDQLGGGFHRYCVDQEWNVPHFEKMLYDNAQLADIYVEAFRRTNKPLYRETAEGIFEYVMREMMAKRRRLGCEAISCITPSIRKRTRSRFSNGSI